MPLDEFEMELWVLTHWEKAGLALDLEEQIEKVRQVIKFVKGWSNTLFEGEIGTMLAQVNEFREKMEIEKKKIVKLGQDELFKHFLPIFEQNPKLESLSWTQYTPYFNDGDECTFSVNSDYFEMVYDGQEMDDVHYSGVKWNKETGKCDKVPPYVRGYGGEGVHFDESTEEGVGVLAAVKGLQELLVGLGDDLCLAIWGNHMRVTLSREGFVGRYCICTG